MSIDWHGLVGQIGQLAGTSGTATVPAGAVVTALTVHASAGAATFTLFGGPPVAVINGANPIQLQFNHTLFQANPVNGGTIAFVNTDSYLIHFCKQRHTA